jgi:hypothetical protein
MTPSEKQTGEAPINSEDRPDQRRCCGNPSWKEASAIVGDG